MNKSGQSTRFRFSFAELITHCGNVRSGYWQVAWNEFERKYERFIYKKIAERCAALRPPRLQLQFSETVEDILSDVKVALLKEECRSLREFRHKESEPVFLAWLKQIAFRTTRSYLRRNYKAFFSTVDAESLEFTLPSAPQTTGLARKEAFTQIVEALRRQAASNARNTERDIFIFLLYTLSEYNARMFADHPLFKGLGHRVVDNVVNRTRDRLAAHRGLVS